MARALLNSRSDSHAGLRGTFLATLLQFCIATLGVWAACAAPPARAQASTDICIENGGIAKCRKPDEGPVYYRLYYDPLVGGGPYGSQDALYSAVMAEPVCQHTVTPPPWSFTLQSVAIPGLATWTTSIDDNVTKRNCDPPYDGWTSTYGVNQFVPLSCPPPYHAVNSPTAAFPLGYCATVAVQSCQKGQCPQRVGDPIDAISGNLIEHETDYAGNGNNILRFDRTYNYIGTDFDSQPLHGTLGQGWTHSYERRLQLFPNGAVRAVRPDGEDRIFLPVSGGYSASGTATDRLMQYTDAGGNFAGWILLDENNTKETYDSGGYLQTMAYVGGQTVTLTYSTTGTPASIAPWAGLLITVSDAFGHQLNFTYTVAGLIATMTDPAGGVFTYSNSAGVLASVGYPDSTTRQYLYNESSHTSGYDLPYALTGIVDEVGTRYATYDYDGQGLAVGSQLAGGVEQTTLVNRYYSVSQGYGYVYVNDALGAQRRYAYTSAAGLAKFSWIDKPCYTCGDLPYGVAYDANGNVTTRADFNSNLTNYVFDLPRNLETSRTEASGTPRARTISTAWDPNFRLPSSITEANRTTSFTYDSNGNALTKTMTDTTITPNVSRTWTYTYDGYSRVLTADGPRTDISDVATYGYYTCTTGAECGQPHTLSNAASQTTTYNTYNAHGQPLTTTDPNGVVTTLTYDARQRLTSRQVGAETTSFAYWPTGLLKQVTLPDGSYLLYSYDGAHRLTQISDGPGNSVDYTLDGLGNRKAENVYDPSNTLHRTHTRVFNTLNQLYQDVNAAGTAAVTTTFGYDTNGNQTSIAAPLSRNTGNAYDELNRLKQITDPANGITKFGYDANDNLTSVIDPRSLTTSYTYSGFGDLKTQASPDTATTTNTYDSAGNLATSTDARGAVSTYGYDALNRVTSVAYSQGGSTDQTISFSYDVGTNGKGHLTGASDTNHSMGWSYDALGRVTSKTQTVGTVTQSVGYAYTSGNLTSLTTPSGQIVSYGYNGNHQVTSVAVNGATVLNNATYEPLGPINGWTWGNGSTTTRTYDADGKITQIASAGTKVYGYDDAFRITGISDTSAGSANWTYGYDTLDRITSGTSPSVTRGWTYDANGNRLTETGSAPSTYSVSSTSNRISSISGALARTYGYDAAGNTTSYATAAATYNAVGRLKTLSNGGSTETMIYNALGQRVQKTGGTGGTVLYEYDEAGHPLGEYDGTGALIAETVWLGDIPVATLRPNGASVSIYYVHSDQLNTPRQVTRPSDNAQMWTWFSDPFGTDAANANPAGAGAFAHNLRFPGQIFDGQAGLHQNGFRDFDPASGRYIESDPIGLDGGINTYAYGDEAPLQSIDSTGQLAGAPVLPGPTAAVTVAWYAGYSVGTAIYNAFGTQINDALDRVTGRTAAWDEIHKDLDWASYHRACDRPPPPGLNPCETARWAYRQALKCQRLRSDWEVRWGTPKTAATHGPALQQVKDRLKNAAADIAKYCKPECSNGP